LHRINKGSGKKAALQKVPRWWAWISRWIDQFNCAIL